ncbi:hypothetical protein [Alteromonas sp. 14N.309.X.WAT.G.H12]|uniref:hypothetical protein n=1 Tax=Alteromonas sp. 14N.309.X.WAT.G.H12 TaxID=3120824 RepID=UPI002FD4305D
MANTFYFPDPVADELPSEYRFFLTINDLEQQASSVQAALSKIDVTLSFQDCMQIYVEALRLPDASPAHFPVALKPWETLDRINAILLRKHTKAPVFVAALRHYPYPERLITINILASRRVKLSDTRSFGPEQDMGEVCPASSAALFDFCFPPNTQAFNEALELMDPVMRDRYRAQLGTGAFRQSEGYFRFGELTCGDPTVLLFIEDYLSAN